MGDEMSRHVWQVEALAYGQWKRIDGSSEATKWRAEIHMRDWKKAYPKTRYRVVKYLPVEP